MARLAMIAKSLKNPSLRFATATAAAVRPPTGLIPEVRDLSDVLPASPIAVS